MRPVSKLDLPDAAVQRLLIVEDEASTIFAMREFFSFLGYQTDCAAKLTEAMRLLDEHRYDVVITDIHLSPNRSGEGMTVLAYARDLNPDAIVVILTAYASEGSGREARRHGVTLYETKPVGLGELAARIEAARRQRSDAACATTCSEGSDACPE
jgi:DNA-binding response OmpR family regulator